MRVCRVSDARLAGSRRSACRGRATAAASRCCSSRRSWTWSPRCRSPWPAWSASMTPGCGASSTIMSSGPCPCRSRGVRRVAFDETAARRGHDYVSLFVDLDQRPRRVRDRRQGRRDRRSLCRRSQRARWRPPCHRRGLHRHEPGLHQGHYRRLPAAAITFDKFHAVKIINDAVDQVRRAGGKTRTVWPAPATSGSQYGPPVRPASETIDSLALSNLKTARAYRIRLTFQAFYQQPSTRTPRPSSSGGISGRPTAGCSP